MPNVFKSICNLSTSIANYEPPTELREGNVFSCVCLSTGGSLHNTTHDALTSLYSPPLVPAPHPWASDMGPPSPGTNPLLVRSGDNDCRHVQTCSPEDAPLTPMASGQYASYLNAFLLIDGYKKSSIKITYLNI